MSRREYDQPCSLARALDRIGERWSLLVVRELSLGPLRFSDLDHSIGNAPTDVLTKRLRDLEAHGILRRRELEPPSSGVAYELTELGRELERPMLELGRWGLHFERIDDLANLTPASLPNAVRVILQPLPDVGLTFGLRSGGQSYQLRIEDGWIEASRGRSSDAELTLAGKPGPILAALVAGKAGEGGVKIEGDRGKLEELRAMVVLPDRLRRAAPVPARRGRPSA
ncbi:MAG: winged helix-turn-helix transcriptional regulator [Solirubrobacterales bacterium]